MAAPFITPRTPNTAKSVVKFTGSAFVNPAHCIQIYAIILDVHQFPAGHQVTHLAPQTYGSLMADRTKFSVNHTSLSAANKDQKLLPQEGKNASMRPHLQ